MSLFRVGPIHTVLGFVAMIRMGIRLGFLQRFLVGVLRMFVRWRIGLGSEVGGIESSAIDIGVGIALSALGIQMIPEDVMGALAGVVDVQIAFDAAGLAGGSFRFHVSGTGRAAAEAAALLQQFQRAGVLLPAKELLQYRVEHTARRS